MRDWGLICFAIFMLMMIGLFAYIKLKTTITKEMIHIQFSPFIDKKIETRNILSAEILNYGFVGGWGIRLWTKYGTVYNTKGNIGLVLKLKDGKKICVGTQKQKELKAFLSDIDLLSE